MCHASTSRTLSLSLSLHPSLQHSPFVLLLDGWCEALSSERFQLPHFFKVHRAGFSSWHQIFTEQDVGEAGCHKLFYPTHVTPDTHLNYRNFLGSSSSRVFVPWQIWFAVFVQLYLLYAFTWT